MAATIALQYPGLAPNTPFEQVEVGSLPAGDGTIKDADVLLLEGGVVETAATNPASALVGLALHHQNAVFVPPANSTGFDSPFGAYTNTGTALVPGEPSNMHFIYFHNGMQFTFSLDTAVALTQSLVGASVGLVLDSSGIWYVTNAGGPNAVATIKSIVQGPGLGVIGTDNGGRVVVEFIASTLAL